MNQHMLSQETLLGKQISEFHSPHLPPHWLRYNTTVARRFEVKVSDFPTNRALFLCECFGCWWVETFPINLIYHPIPHHNHGQCRGVCPSSTALYRSLLIKRILIKCKHVTPQFLHHVQMWKKQQ